MSAHLVWIVSLLGTSLAVGQSAPASPAGGASGTPTATQAAISCTKTITFAVAEGGQPVPAVPKFAAKWVGKGKHVENYSDLCLSQIPSSRTANYVVIFSTGTASYEGLTPIAHTYSSATPISGEGPGGSSYGGTWSYSYKGTPPDTTTTVDLQKLDGVKKGLLLYTYNQQGHLLSHYEVDGDHSRENRLEQVLADIHRDVIEKANQRRISAPLSVYYVNCDVDSPGPSSLVAAADPATTVPEVKPVSVPQPPPPPPQGTLELVSTPSGADVFVDNKYLGKTPYIVTVPPGQHVVVIRKQDFSTWTRDLQVAPGPRRVSAYLEQKFLTLPSSSPQTAPPPAQYRAVQPQTTQRPAAPLQAGQQPAQQRTTQTQATQRPATPQQAGQQPAQYRAVQPQTTQRPVAPPQAGQQSAQPRTTQAQTSQRQSPPPHTTQPQTTQSQSASAPSSIAKQQ